MKKRKPRAEGTVERGHVIRLDPTCKQAHAFACACGVARQAFNWGLAEWQRQYKAGLKPTADKLKKQYNAIKGEQFPWVYDSPKDANQQAFTDLGTDFSNFFSSCKGERKGKRVGYPKFKKKGVHDSFYVSNEKFEVRARGKRGVVRLPVIGDVRMREQLRFQGKILSARVSRQADEWYISIQVETDAGVPWAHKYASVGVDLGIKTAVVPSHGKDEDAPKPLKAALAKLRRTNRKLRRRHGVENHRKTRIARAKLYLRIANVRKDFLHKVTTKIVRENQTVVIEDLNVAGMARNHRLARALSDVGMGMFREFMTYKAPVYGTELVVASRWFPSTKRCSRCGHVNAEMPLSERIFRCEECGYVELRDKNASYNLEQYPGLPGNWGPPARTPTDTRASTALTATSASAVVEVGTKPCSLVSTL